MFEDFTRVTAHFQNALEWKHLLYYNYQHFRNMFKIIYFWLTLHILFQIFPGEIIWLHGWIVS